MPNLTLPIQAAAPSVADAFLSLGTCIPEAIPVSVVEESPDTVWLAVIGLPLELVLSRESFHRYIQQD